LSPRNLDEFLPTEYEKKQVVWVRDKLLQLVQTDLNKANIPAKVMLVGSTAKDTFVRGDTDIDIFIVTPRYLEAFKHFQTVIPFGYRKEGPMDIWHYLYDEFDVDLVFIPPDHPRIDTLIHTEFMNRNLTPKQKEEVIRAKAFFKSKGVYGAEIGGIVGIAVEELIRRHDTLEAVCRTLSEADATPFVEDPAKPTRTLLASLKPIRWKQLQNACRDYLNTRRFIYKTYDINTYFADRKEWSHVTFNRLRDRPIDFHTALSSCNHVLRMIRNKEPEVKGRCDAYILDRTLISYQVSPKELPKTATKCGPPLHMTEAVEAFKTVHPASFEQNGLICTTIEREKTNIIQWMQDEITQRMEKRGYTTAMV